MTDAERSAHLPAVFNDLVERLRHPLPLARRTPVSPAAAKHGLLRREQGYTAAMMARRIAHVASFYLPNIAVISFTT